MEQEKRENVPEQEQTATDQSAEDVLQPEVAEEPEPSVGPGPLTRLGLFAGGGMPHLYPLCSPTCLMYRSSIGWVLLMGMLIDFIITTFGWHPIVGWVGSAAIATLWVALMLSVDRSILRSMDGSRRPRFFVLVLRVLAIFIQVALNSGLALMIFLGSSIDKHVAEKYDVQRRAVSQQMAVVEQRFTGWNDARQQEIGEASRVLATDRQRCLDEAVGKASAKTSGKVGIGRLTQMCNDAVAAEAIELEDLKATYSAQLPKQRQIADEQKNMLRAELDKINQTQAKGDGFLGRIFEAFVVARLMAKEQPGMTLAFLLVDLLIIIMQLLPFGSKLAHEEDQYDVAFRDDIGWTERDRLAVEEAERQKEADEGAALAAEQKEHAALLRKADLAEATLAAEQKIAALEKARLELQEELAKARAEAQEAEERAAPRKESFLQTLLGGRKKGQADPDPDAAA